VTIRKRKLAPGLWQVEADGRLDQHLTPELEMALNEVIGYGHSHIIVDLTHATYINSSGLRVLLTGWRRAQKEDGNLVICGLNDQLAEVFRMIGLNQVVGIYKTPADARKLAFN
jgi:anti-sigma B factor antagonist